MHEAPKKNARRPCRTVFRENCGRICGRDTKKGLKYALFAFYMVEATALPTTARSVDILLFLAYFSHFLRFSTLSE